MRTIVGVIAVLALAVTVAGAQPPRERGAAFRPPEPLQPGDLPSVARGAADEFPPSSFMPATPVTRPNTRVPGAAGPAWLTGADANVLPASGTAPKTGVRPVTPAPTALQSKDDAAPAPKVTDKPKTPAARPQPTQPQPAQPTAETPYRGTSANGAPVYAGPPAYRWYGWGTVTPGANPFAPTGQYPKASAKWYEITGATPGAFPVQVMNPLRTPPGTEPPTYTTARLPAPQSVVPVADQSPPRPQVIERPEPPRFNPPADTRFVPPPASVVPPAAVNVPKITPPPAVPAPVAVKEPEPITVPKPEPVVVVPPPVLPPIPVLPVLLSVEPAKPVAVAPPTPLPLPTSVTEEPKPVEPTRVEVKVEAPKPVEQRWQTSPEPAHPAPGTWTPTGQPLPVMPANDEPGWKSGAAPAKPVVVRAQMPADSDPVATLIRQVCQGRAEGVDIRWNGTKKVMVCFEVRAAAEAQKLVTDISRRPELAPYQIDFCAVVK